MNKQQDLFISGKTNWFHFFTSVIEGGDLAKMSKACHAVPSVLLVVKSYTNYSEGVSFPGIETIVEKSGFSKKSVINALKILSEYGYLEITRSGRKNVYKVIEKFKAEHRETGESIEVTAEYVPEIVSAMRAELKEFFKDGRTRGQYINIPIAIQVVNGGTGNQHLSSDIGNQIAKSGQAVGRLQAMVDDYKVQKKSKDTQDED